jgi:hypothetical protein
MSEEELVEAYTDGRVGRRMFVRKLVAGGLTLGAALAYAEALAPAAFALDANQQPPRPPKPKNPNTRNHHRDLHGNPVPS